VARIVLVVVLAAVVAGCGARSETARDRPAQLDPSRGDVAAVGIETITSAQVDAVLDETAASFQALGRPFPEAARGPQDESPLRSFYLRMCGVWHGDIIADIR